jgi:hypothetical protein
MRSATFSVKTKVRPVEFPPVAETLPRAIERIGVHDRYWFSRFHKRSPCSVLLGFLGDQFFAQRLKVTLFRYVPFVDLPAHTEIK